jgi:hypothetical protein
VVVVAVAAFEAAVVCRALRGRLVGSETERKMEAARLLEETEAALRLAAPTEVAEEAGVYRRRRRWRRRRREGSRVWTEASPEVGLEVQSAAEYRAVLRHRRDSLDDLRREFRVRTPASSRRRPIRACASDLVLLLGFANTRAFTVLTIRGSQSRRPSRAKR